MTASRSRHGPWPREEIAAGLSRHVKRTGAPLEDVAAVTGVPVTVIREIVSGNTRVPYAFFRPVRTWVAKMDEACDTIASSADPGRRKRAQKIAKGELPPEVEPAAPRVPFDAQDDHGPRGRPAGETATQALAKAVDSFETTHAEVIKQNTGGRPKRQNAERTEEPDEDLIPTARNTKNIARLMHDVAMLKERVAILEDGR